MKIVMECYAYGTDLCASHLSVKMSIGEYTFIPYQIVKCVDEDGSDLCFLLFFVILLGCEGMASSYEIHIIR